MQKAQFVVPVDSAVNQTMDALYEVILIDYGSRDRSAEILDEYVDQYTYVRVIHQANQGITRTRENGIRAARGEYIFWGGCR